MFKYYMILRPPMPGAMPRNNLTDMKDFGDRTYAPEIGREAWGWITYSEPLSKKDIEHYDLVPGN